MTFTKKQIAARPKYTAYLPYKNYRVVIDHLSEDEINCIQEQIFAERLNEPSR